MKILGIETSCDETAAAVVKDGRHVLSNVIASSLDMHKATGGVVPEVAAREHLRQITPVIDQAMRQAGAEWKGIDAIAVTNAPGLISSLLIGINTAQAIAYIHGKPLIPVHHIAGHIYANFLEQESEVKFPILVLTVSGGHNELVLMRGHFDFQVIGETLDDAAGEAFDKVARILDLGFPGGPAIARAAEEGNAEAISFPRALMPEGPEKAKFDKANLYNFSFSGLKSAVLREVRKHEKLTGKAVADIAASFQKAVVSVLADKLFMAAESYKPNEIHLAGGVSANRLLRKVVSERLPRGVELRMPRDLIYCTDNAAMVAAAAYFWAQKYPGKVGGNKHIEAHSQMALG